MTGRQAMVARARSRGKAASGIYLLPRMETRLPESIRFPNCRLRLVSSRHLYQAQVQFHFRVSFVSDERVEELTSVIVDSLTEEVDRLPRGFRLYDFSLFGQNGRRGEEVNYREKRLYEVACRHLETVMAGRIEAVRKETEARLLTEQAQVSSYYDKLKSEALEPVRRVFRQLASATVFRDLAKTPATLEKYNQRARELKALAGRAEKRYEKQLATLEVEKERRLAELEEKYRLRVEAELIGACRLMVPRQEFVVRLSGPARFELSFTYDVLRRYQIGIFCERCDKQPLTIFLTEDGETLCRDCWKANSRD